jgi:uncharacterized membrane protein
VLNRHSVQHRAARGSMVALLGAMIVFAINAQAAQDSGRDIVVKAEKDGTTFTVNAEMAVQATVDEVWAVLVDFDNMARILSNVDASRIANRDGDKFEVIQKSHAAAGPVRLSLDSVRQVELVPKREIRSHLVKGDLKASDFVTRVNEDGPGVRVSVSGKFVAGGFSGGVISPETVENQTRRQYQELRDEVMRRKSSAPTPPCILAKNCP